MNPCSTVCAVCIGIIRTDRNGTWTFAIPRLVYGGTDEEGPFYVYNPLLGTCIFDSSVNAPARKLQLPNACSEISFEKRES